MKSKLIKTLAAAFIAAVFITVFPASASAESAEVTFSKASSGDQVTITAETSIAALYIRFPSAPGEWTLAGADGSTASCGSQGFMHEYVDVSALLGAGTQFTLSFSGGIKPENIYAFDGTDVPDWVQIWEAPCEKADFMLISTHADDEQLFFAGVLPYYAQVRNYAVQVVYATDHYAQPSRHHERLDGLWAVGIRHYPVSMGLPDAYSESYDGALSNLKSSGISEEDVIALEKEMISRFSPQVIATHDVNGEYGHGQHILVNGTLQKALENAETDYPFLKKVYFHLYEQNPVVLSFLDEPFDELGGLTPFQVTQKGFGFHESQHWTWFKRWIYGSNNEITTAAQIKTYNPMYYGLYYGDPSLDAGKNDLMEGITSYADIAEAERLAEEERLRAEEEAARKAEEERILAEKEAAEEAARQAAAKKKKIMITAAAAGVVILGAVLVLAGGRGKKRGKHSK